MTRPTTSWQAVFFDFDGVIADSIAVKTQAFATLFAPYGPEVQEKVIHYHLDNGGMPRQEKIQHCSTQFAQVHLSKKVLQQMAGQFSQLVLDQVIRAPLIEGAAITLRQLQQQHIPCFVVSGTPHEEMRFIVQQKNLNAFFREVHGSPRNKTTIVSEILERFAFLPAHCLFIGDALADYQAARDTGLEFLGIVPPGKPSLFPEAVRIRSQVILDW